MLEACPICGYAVNTETLQCRHCASGAQVKAGSPVWLNAIGFAAALGGAIYLLFFR